jgi:exosortase
VISGFRFQVSSFRQKLWLLPLAWLWFVLINDLRVEWTVNPQYGYGWAVPFLCVFLIWQKFQTPGTSGQWSVVSSRKMEACAPAGGKFQVSGFRFQLFVLALCALLYAPTRLVEEANPDWRLVSWALAIEVVGLTLICVRLALGAQRLAQLVFPVCFFLVAVPWPTGIETPLIQGLTRLDTIITTELLGWIGIPAIPHGNVIEVATGMVGIDEACSGIRSFQATLMISLFLGEFYSLGAWHRALCVSAGFALSVLFNLARMSLLVWVAARKGINAIATWHDPAGVTVLVACFFSLWGMGVWLQSAKRKAQSAKGGAQSAERKAKIEPSTFNFQLSTLRKVGLALGIWIVISEAGIEAWYRSHEARQPAAIQWTVSWPTNNATFKEMEIAPVTRQLLRYSDGRLAEWQEGGLGWQAVFLHWKTGAISLRLAEEHTPQTCLPTAGHDFVGGDEIQYLTVHDLKMPFRFYQITDTPQPTFLAYCLWDDRASTRSFESAPITRASRLLPVLAGQRASSKRTIQIAVTGANDLVSAQAALRAELQQLVVVKPDDIQN